ncbi:MAG: bifunctional methylenetetrahydrofolate dehydrogenase/methenyltetrahydrofolate cyclohydrolase FolD [Myxococcales bacterium]|nr:bifunctional methylenetetrahydrofolate dehydrogenase/methenyltetrahydrofolate cyclohydrolase FolD [Myxococcales bacterium]
MTESNLLDGKGIALKVREQVRQQVEKRVAQGHRAPGLATVLVGEDPASQVYVRNKHRAAEKAGIVNFHKELPADISQQGLLQVIDELNNDDAVDGILCQLPLPKHLDEDAVIMAIDPQKDVDGFHPQSTSALYQGKPNFVPCTPKGCMVLLDEAGIDLNGKNAVVVGRSHIVGKPMAHLLLGANCTVTICHSRTQDLASHTRKADVVVAAVGRSEMLTDEHISEGTVVIDVGINRGEDGKLRGDVDFAKVSPVAKAITPVPGGVGPMTIAMLMYNTCLAHQRRLGIEDES